MSPSVSENDHENRPMTLEEKWIAVALLYGPPDRSWHSGTPLMFAPLSFRMALEKVFDPANVKRVGLVAFAMEYADWYYVNEKKIHAAPA